MELTQLIILILLLLILGVQTAGAVVCCIEEIKRPIGKILVWSSAVILPFLFLIVLWIYAGIAVCSQCKSITINTYTVDHWIIDVPYCRKCPKHFDGGKQGKKDIDSEPAELPEKTEKNFLVLYILMDLITNRHDDETGEIFVKAVFIFWLLGYVTTMIVGGSLLLIKKYRSRGDKKL